MVRCADGFVSASPSSSASLEQAGAERAALNEELLDASLANDEQAAATRRQRRISRERRRRVSRDFESVLENVSSLNPASAGDHAPSQQSEAASVIQRCWKGRKRRRLIIRWREAAAALRASYLDERAMKAGAESSPLYTNAALAARDALRKTDEVEAALSAAWASCRACVSAHGFRKKEYKRMSRLLCMSVALPVEPIFERALGCLF